MGNQMINYVIRNMHNRLDEIRINLGEDLPLWIYVKEALRDIEVLNILNLYNTNKDVVAPFIHVHNFRWNPRPQAHEIQYRRRETGTKIRTKTVGDVRMGILTFDIYAGARDKNEDLEEFLMLDNKIYIPIADEKGRYLIDNIYYPEYQLVDKLLYPKGENFITLKSLLPVDVKYERATETALGGYLVDSKIGMVKIFSTMEPILSCFMHIPCVLSYLEVFPILQFCDQVLSDTDKYAYFKPLPDVEIYIKGYKKGLDKFNYVRSILVMACHLIRKHKPESVEQLRDPKWWIYELSYCDNIIEHRGACHQMYVTRMLDTISAQVLPIPDIDKRIMTSLLKYVIQTEFTDVNILSFENKRLRLNEVISTIITASVSDKLKKMFSFGTLLKTKDMQSHLKFQPDIIFSKLYNLQTVSTIDFANDMDYPHLLKYTRKGPNSLGKNDKHKISHAHKQLHPSMIGTIDLLDYTKEVGQSGMLSPYGNLDSLFTKDILKYPNVKFDLYDFIRNEFPDSRSLRFEAKDIQEYNAILDKLVKSSYINLDYRYRGEDRV